MDEEQDISVISAKYKSDYSLEVTFSNGVTKTVDFSSHINNHTKGYYTKYKKLSNFKKFKIEDGNIVWGKDWDLIFTIEGLYSGKL